MTLSRQRAVGLATALLVFGLSVLPTVAGGTGKDEGVKLRAQLIWGTNDDKPPGAGQNELEGPLRKKLSGIFKWKHYFEVKRTEQTIGPKTTKRLKLSPECEVEIKNLGSGMVSAKLFGDGKALLEQKLNLSSKEPVVLGGHGKDKTAWFVVLSPL